jgi:hypothetical protein
MVMDIQRDALHQAIDQLPEDVLDELAKFIQFLQFKVQHDEQSDDLEREEKNTDIDSPLNAEGRSPFNPVYFPEGLLKGVDFSPEYIKEARREFWAGLGEDFE